MILDNSFPTRLLPTPDIPIKVIFINNSCLNKMINHFPLIENEEERVRGILPPINN
jgi:hypothetical protein